jgi:hypothetical protein
MRLTGQRTTTPLNQQEPKKHSRSANRLRDHTLTGLQINLARLATVPSAQFATQAGSARPSGAAGGDLSGSYPNPTVVNSQQLAGKTLAQLTASTAFGTVNATDLVPNPDPGARTGDNHHPGANQRVGSGAHQRCFLSHERRSM